VIWAARKTLLDAVFQHPRLIALDQFWVGLRNFLGGTLRAARFVLSLSLAADVFEFAKVHCRNLHSFFYYLAPRQSQSLM